MSKKDKINQKITHLRFWLGICVALIISLSGWIFSNLDNWINFKYRIIISLIGVIFLVFGVLKINKRIESLINELEEL